MKMCLNCKRELPTTNEYFYNDECKKDGLTDVCRECVESYIDSHEEYSTPIYKKYREECEKEMQEFSKHLCMYEKAKEDALLIDKKIKEDALLRQLCIYKKIKKATYDKKYRKDNPEKFCIKGHHYRSLKRGLLSTLTPEQWTECKDYFGGHCAYCGEKKALAQEHFIPVSKGGSYSAGNIIPACKSCNSSKGAKDFFVFYPTYKHYSKDRETKILKFLNYNNGNQQLRII